MTARKHDSRRFRASATLASLVVALTVLCASAILIPQAQETALDRYVNSQDPVYGWKLINTAHGEGYQAFVLELTSQTWRTAAEVDRPVWKHWLTIVKPLRDDEPHGDALHRRRQQRRSCAHRRRPAHRQLRPRIEHRCRRSGNGAESAAGVRRLEGQAAIGRRPDRLHAGQALLDEGRHLARSPGDGQERRARHGRHSGIPGKRGRRPPDRRPVRRVRWIEARLDDMARRRGGRPRRRDHADGHRRAQFRG